MARRLYYLEAILVDSNCLCVYFRYMSEIPKSVKLGYETPIGFNEQGNLDIMTAIIKHFGVTSEQAKLIAEGNRIVVEGDKTIEIGKMLEENIPPLDESSKS